MDFRNDWQELCLVQRERAEAAEACEQRLRETLKDARNALAYLDKHPYVGVDAELAAIDAALKEQP